MSGGYLLHAGIIAGALTDALITSILKVAVGGHIYGVWNIAWDIE